MTEKRFPFMRTLDVSNIRDAVRDLCIGANLQLPGDLCGLIEKSTQTETDPLGREVLCDPVSYTHLDVYKRQGFFSGK